MKAKKQCLTAIVLVPAMFVLTSCENMGDITNLVKILPIPGDRKSVV